MESSEVEMNKDKSLGHVVVLITAPDAKEADFLSRGLGEEKLAYCVNAIPGVKSTYSWDGEVCVEDEIQLVAKTRATRFLDLEQWVNVNHSYDVPEIIALPLSGGAKTFLKCIDDWVPEN